MINLMKVSPSLFMFFLYTTTGVPVSDSISIPTLSFDFRKRSIGDWASGSWLLSKFLLLIFSLCCCFTSTTWNTWTRWCCPNFKLNSYRRSIRLEDNLRCHVLWLKSTLCDILYFTFAFVVDFFALAVLITFIHTLSGCWVINVCGILIPTTAQSFPFY